MGSVIISIKQTSRVAGRCPHYQLKSYLSHKRKVEWALIEFLYCKYVIEDFLNLFLSAGIL